MERVSGIGGFFFRAEDPEALARWYETMLGVGRVPQSMDDQPWKQEAGTTAFAPMGRETTMLGDASRSWSINFRVRDLAAMAAQLRSAGVEVDVDPETYAMGRFASLADPEGNIVQLWEPGGPAAG